MSIFEPGHRVICIANPDNDPDSDLIGYYGHVTEVLVSLSPPDLQIVNVSLQGRVGAEAKPHYLDPHGDDPFLFYAHEITHAD